MITRIWQGRKECAVRDYYCGQVLNREKDLWETVTPEFESKSMAEAVLCNYRLSQIMDGKSDGVVK